MLEIVKRSLRQVGKPPVALDEMDSGGFAGDGGNQVKIGGVVKLQHRAPP